MRTFIAAELSELIRRELARIQTVLKSKRFKFRWVQPENIHLTLVFLGEVDERLIEKIANASAATTRCFAPIPLSVQGLGAFPSIKRARVLWAGINGDVHQLRELKKSLDEALASVDGLGFKAERRSYKAHLTLGRAKGRVDEKLLADTLVNVQPSLSASFTVNEIHLIKSDLRPGGAIYTRLRSAKLK